VAKAYGDGDRCADDERILGVEKPEQREGEQDREDRAGKVERPATDDIADIPEERDGEDLDQ